MTRTTRAGRAAAALLLLTACGTGAPTPLAGPGTGAEPSSPIRGMRPALVVGSGSHEVLVHPHTYCWHEGEQGVCSDGNPTEPYADLGVADEVGIRFDRSGWTFSAYAVPAGDRCGRIRPTPVWAEGKGWRLLPAGPAGAYDVSLSGRGPQGDVQAVFRLTTTLDRPEPAAEALVSSFWQSSEGPTVAAIGIGFRHLRSTPDEASGRVSITSGDGTARTLPLVEPRPEQGDPCPHIPGSLWLRADVPGATSRDSVDARPLFGEPPYRHRVEVVLDGARHVAETSWPDGLDAEGNYLDLAFSPPLPGL
ncbi:hypothetical protein [Motilibacter aurantiacus]|uniref:hypothetical protein n=1 Tax=Motilibacter aurantiacus TaxID=2714955 RepID=UPI00140C8427|nr:hypothetical protein [Motilibacter aurantiacus]NHC47188.1 hypothetical protein [Motilibacter aurantiacus]